MSDPKLTWLELLSEISTWSEPFFIKEVVRHFDLRRGEASGRINRLRGWGYLRFYSIPDKGQGGFVVTEYGNKRVEKGV